MSPSWIGVICEKEVGNPSSSSLSHCFRAMVYGLEPFWCDLGDASVL